MMTYTSKNSNGLFSLPKLIGQDGLFCDGDWIESKDQDPAGDVRLVQMMDIGDGEYLDKSSRFLTKQKAQELRCTFLRKGDILISRMPDPLGRACIFPGDSRQCVTAVDVCIVRPDSKLVDIRWLLHKINSPEFRYEINKWTTGTTRQRISRTNLGKITFPLPPLAEQKRIAAILDKADAIRRKRQQAIQLADEFLRSVFLDMFGDPVTNPKGWKKIALGDLVKVRSGDFLPANRMDSRGSYLVYGGNGVNGSHSEYMFAEPVITIGRVGVYCGAIHVTKPKSWVTDNALYVSEKKDSLRNSYFEWALRFANLNQYASQSGQPLISGNRIYPVKIVVPDIEQQDRFDEILQKQKPVVSKMHMAQSETYQLFNSLTQRAFRGEL